MARFRIGTAFLGRYVLLGPIGHGGVSVVHQALDTVRGRQVAIKMLDPTLADDPHAQQRIRREALITDRVRHPGVPRVYDFGDAPLGDGTTVPYVVMELLVGRVLTASLAEGALPWRRAARVAASIADVLVAAHRRGVVHRDLTPSNIMITPDGAKIIDFGVAVTVQAPDPGKGPYVLPPPVQLANDFAGPGEPSDDVYALGVLLYQMVTGRSPYPSTDQPPPIASATMNWVAPTPVLAVAGLPKEVAEIVRRCMAKRPADRPDAAAVALSLWAQIVPAPDAIASIAPVSTLPAVTAPDEPTVRLLAKPPTLQPPPAGRPRRRRRPAWSDSTTGQNSVVGSS